jgi:hypothetical protein
VAAVEADAVRVVEAGMERQAQEAFAAETVRVVASMARPDSEPSRM